MFRGFILNRLNESLTLWKSNLISAFLFVLAHVPYWVSKNGFSARVIRDLANVFVLGLLFGWLMKKPIRSGPLLELISQTTFCRV